MKKRQADGEKERKTLVEDEDGRLRLSVARRIEVEGERREDSRAAS